MIHNFSFFSNISVPGNTVTYSTPAPCEFQSLYAYPYTCISIFISSNTRTEVLFKNFLAAIMLLG